LTLKNVKEIIKIAINTIRIESEAIAGLEKFIGEDFVSCVEKIYNSRGRVIVTGIGKSAIVGQKIVATLNSTGTPAVFMHAADAIHGDLGIIQKDDIVICLSKSGETAEIKVLLPLLKQQGSLLIALVGNTGSYLAKQADYVLNSTVTHEACPNNLAPTSSSTAQLVMGDALAVSLLECRGFSAKDFARIHPGGMLGKQLYLKVGDLSGNNPVPKVETTDNLKKVILEISSKRLGATAVLEGKKLKGIITDGDLRRMLEKRVDFLDITAKEIMSENPKTVEPGMLVINALTLMRQNNITQLLVVENDKYTGVIHLHDILKEGII
jgi:arabinose-5-phosphate isomerase